MVVPGRAGKKRGVLFISPARTSALSSPRHKRWTKAADLALGNLSTSQLDKHMLEGLFTDQALQL